MRKFPEFPQFTPNVVPKDIFKKGAYGGTYFRPIYSSVTNTQYKSSDVIREYPKSWWRGIDIDKYVVSEVYDKSVNKYGVKCGSSLEYWESKGWMHEQDPYGWMQWYCRFYRGRRTDDDERQIKRWEKLAGPRGRFRRRLMNEIIKRDTTFNDFSVSPVIRQVLLHWGYELSATDLEEYTTELASL
jgi:hypothetical protein